MGKQIQIKIPFDQNLDDFLKESYPDVVDYRILSKSLDSRLANRGKVPSWQYSLEVLGKEGNFDNFAENFSFIGPLKSTPIIVGAGPAGLFCALRLLEYGIPSIIIERGAPAYKRMKYIGRYWRYGELDQENNVCFYSIYYNYRLFSKYVKTIIK
mgnify:CR=1 FL=1